MSTLAEIEAAAEALPTPEKEELVRSLNRQLERERLGQTKGETTLEDFAGVLRLPQDPLAWQREVRGEW